MLAINNKKLVVKIVLINLLVAFFWVLGFGISILGFPYFNFLNGLIFFFLPGINLALFLTQITGRRLRIISLFLFGVLISFLLNPTIIYIFSLLFNRIGQEQFVLLVFLLYWIFSFVLLLLSCCWGKKHFLDFNFAFLKKHKILLFVFLALIFIAGLGFLLYPYVPEADGYSYMVKIRDTLTYHRMPLSESRPLFFALVWLLLFLTKIPIYWLFKIVFPLLLFLVLALVFYGLSFSKIKNRLLLIVSSLAFLSCPVIFAEVLYARPQTVFILSFVVLLFVLRDFILSSQAKDYFWLGFLLLFNILGLKIHLFFVFNILLVLVVLFFSLRNLARKYPLESLVIFLVVVFGSYPWLRDWGFVDQIARLVKPFIQSLIHPHFDLWFIDYYVNVFGNELGWPGITQLYYYAYNLGLFLPCFLILFLAGVRQKRKLFSRGSWIWILGFIMFFSIAEIFPRLGVAFLPDRAWLYVSLILIFFVPTVLSIFGKKLLKKKVWFIVFMLSFVLSVLASLFVVYAKQGWVTKEEIRAAEFIKENTSSNSVFVTQKGNYPLVRYFAQRFFVQAPKEFFLGGEIDSEDLEFLNNLSEKISKKKEYLVQNEEIAKKMKVVLGKMVDPDNLEISSYIKEFSVLESKLLRNKLFLKAAKLYGLDQKRPAYILYSEGKFDSLYGMREWWKKDNFYGANLDKFDNNPNFEKIYNKGGVRIWKLKK
ncbi:hypothetical protein J7K05_02415 [bacterium]|nr:hypothetical protein [bacterium]